MKKGRSLRKLGRTSNERKQLFRNLIREVSAHGYMETSEAKAKALRPQLEKLITTGKDDTLTAFRRLVESVGDVETAKTLQKLGELFKKRPGGYTRLIRLGRQGGDNTSVVRLELVEKLAIADIITPQNTDKKILKPETKKLSSAKETKVKILPKNKKVRQSKQI